MYLGVIHSSVLKRALWATPVTYICLFCKGTQDKIDWWLRILFTAFSMNALHKCLSLLSTLSLTFSVLRSIPPFDISSSHTVFGILPFFHLYYSKTSFFTNLLSTILRICPYRISFLLISTCTMFSFPDPSCPYFSISISFEFDAMSLVELFYSISLQDFLCHISESPSSHACRTSALKCVS